MYVQLLSIDPAAVARAIEDIGGSAAKALTSAEMGERPLRLTHMDFIVIIRAFASASSSSQDVG